MKNKTIFITGVSRGLGLALANYWQKDNSIIGIARTDSKELHPNVKAYKCDLANEAQTLATIQHIIKENSRIDILINNAAVLTSLPLGIMGNEDITRMIDVNLKAPILISKAIFRRMTLAKSGQIINILSMAPKLSVVGDSVYAATKSGLEAFSRVLNKEGHSFGVQVNNIGVTAYSSDMLGQIIKNNPQKILDLIPHKQFTQLEDVVSTIEFLCSGSKDIGGQTIYFGGI